jgi:ABC-type sugar transport system ATPase subunit
MNTRLTVEDAYVTFGQTTALSGADLTVLPGEIHALVGPNGAGKSTMFRVIGGEIQPSAGKMWINGEPFNPSSPADARKAGVSIVHQEPNLPKDLTVADYMFWGNPRKRFGFLQRASMRAAAEEAIGKLGHQIDGNRLCGDLSISQQQVVDIARTILWHTQVLILDEPTSRFTAQDKAALFTLVRRLAASGTSIIYVSHFLKEVLDLANRWTILRDGTVVKTEQARSTTVQKLAELMLGRSLGDLYARSKRDVGEPALTVRDLKAPRLGVDHLCVRHGQVTGIMGVIGSGRTRLFRTLFGLEPYTSGSITVSSLSGQGTAARWQDQGTGMVFENRLADGLFAQLSLASNIIYPAPHKAAQSGFLFPHNAEALTTPLLSRLGVKCEGAHQPAGQLSGGNAQLLQIARLMWSGAGVLFLDEPTRGIDMGNRARVYNEIDQLASNGAAIVMVSSDPEELLGVCDEVAVMRNGHLSAPRPVSELDPETLHIQAIS